MKKNIMMISLLIAIIACKNLEYHPTDIMSDGTQELDQTDSTVTPGSTPATPTTSVVLIRPEKVLIYELYYDDPVSDTDGTAFIELYATPESSIDGYKLEIINGDDGKTQKTITLPPGSKVPKSGFFVVADLKTNSTTESQVPLYHYLTQLDPQNGPDSVRLVSDKNIVMDILGYGELPATIANIYEGESALDVIAGVSLSRVSVDDSNDNRSDFFANLEPSPGSIDVTLPQNDDDTGSKSDNETIPAVDGTLPEIAQVKFTEVVTDPQQDWNDSSGGNGILFDEIAGFGTIGTTDEYFEIKNFGKIPVDINNWSILMMDGTDNTFYFSSPADSQFFSSQDGENFILESEEFLVLGNPPGDMRNTITLTMLDGYGNTVDEVFIEDGNANDVSDESFSLDDDGNWIKTSASLGW